MSDTLLIVFLLLVALVAAGVLEINSSDDEVFYALVDDDLRTEVERHYDAGEAIRITSDLTVEVTRLLSAEQQLIWRGKFFLLE